MNYGLYCIKDLATGIFDSKVHCFSSDRDAAFNFKKACSVPGTILNLKPSDFAIYCIGNFSSKDGYVGQCIPYAVDLSIIPDLDDVSRETSVPGKEET